MDDDTFNISLRKFLKMVGVSSQREIEQAVEKARAAGKIAGNETLASYMTLEIPAVGLKVKFDGDIKLRRPGEVEVEMPDRDKAKWKSLDDFDFDFNFDFKIPNPVVNVEVDTRAITRQVTRSVRRSVH